MTNFILGEERKNNRGRNLEFRYQVTMMDANGHSLDSEWVDTKQEAMDMANKIMKNPKNADVSYCMVYNMLNQKLNFKMERGNES